MLIINQTDDNIYVETLKGTKEGGTIDFVEIKSNESKNVPGFFAQHIHADIGSCVILRKSIEENKEFDVKIFGMLSVVSGFNRGLGTNSIIVERL